MKLLGAFNLSQSESFDNDFLLDHDVTNKHHRKNMTKNTERSSAQKSEVKRSNGVNPISSDVSRSPEVSKSKNSKSETSNDQHISRRWCYITPNDDASYHRVILEAPFVRMKEIHITPPRYPIREDSKNIRLAESKKEEGNKLFKQKKYIEACKYYSKAIELCPKVASYYGNRSACYILMGKFKESLDDAQKSVKLDPNFIKGYLREAKSFINLGDLNAALRSYENLRKIEPDCEDFLADYKNLQHIKKCIDDAEKYTQKNDHRTALYNIERALSYASECNKFKLLKAECLALLGRHKEAQDIATDILRSDEMNVDALYIRGMSLYYQDNIDKAFTHFQLVLRYNPDHNKAKDVFKKAKSLISKKQEGNKAFGEGKIEEAYEIYTSALEIDPQNCFTNAKLYFNRAATNAKRKNIGEAIEDCNKAIKLDPDYLKCYLRRAKFYTENEMYEEAVRDYELVYKREKTRENKQLLEQAKLELKKSKRKDYYKILGVGKDASVDDIKKAYKKRALIHHPDRHSSASQAERSEQEKKFKEVGEAYAVLTDPKKRQRYDNGFDLDGGSGDGFETFDIDPNTIFQTFFHQGPAFNHFTSFQGGSGQNGQFFGFPF